MGNSTQASDWKVTLIGEITLPTGIVAWAFQFKSKEANCFQQFLFVGNGNGLGGIISKGAENYTSLECNQAFSIENLDWAVGQAATGGAAVVVGAGVVIITASTIFSGYLFKDQPITDITFGFGTVVFGFYYGLWKKF